MPENGPGFQSTGRRPPPAPESMPLAVLYQDAWLIAVDKPPGLVVHPTYRNWSGTLLNGLLWHVSAGTEPRIVTRLDKNTSGLVLVALSADVHRQMQRDAAAGRVTKEYLAIVEGVPSPARGSIEAPLARSAADRRLVVVDAAGQPCRTDYELLASSADPASRIPDPASRIPAPASRIPDPGSRALVRCELVTGRTHQIRVHLASRGWPIVGDPVYGAPEAGVARQALHAWRVTLPHPISREILRLEVPLPADLRALFRGPHGHVDL